MRFFVVADRRKALSSDALRSVNRSLDGLATILNDLETDLYDEEGTGDSDALLLSVGSGHAQVDVDDVQVCGAIGWPDQSKDRKSGDALESAVRSCAEAYWADLNSDHSPRLIMLLGAPPDSWQALSDALDDWPVEAATPLVIACSDELSVDAAARQFRVIPERILGVGAVQAWLQSSPHTGAESNPASSVPTASHAIVAIPSLQSVLDGAKSAASVPLRSGEYIGGCTVSRSVALEGESSDTPASILGSAGCALVLAAPNITLRNLLIEAAPGDFAIERKPEATQLSLDAVTVRGRVLGIPGEDGTWDIPESLDLGQLPASSTTSRLLVLDTPVSCILHSPVSGFRFEPTRIDAGVSQVTLHISTGTAGAVVFGYLVLRSNCFHRRVQIVGSYHAGVADRPDSVLWACKRPLSAPSPLPPIANPQGTGPVTASGVGNSNPSPPSAPTPSVGAVVGGANLPDPRGVEPELWLRVLSGPKAGEVIPVPRKGLAIGSADGNDLCLKDPLVRRWHVHVASRNGHLEFRELGSPKGPIHRGRESAGVIVSVGGTILVGASMLEVVDPKSGTSKVYHPQARVGSGGASGMSDNSRPLGVAGRTVGDLPSEGTARISNQETKLDVIHAKLPNHGSLSCPISKQVDLRVRSIRANHLEHRIVSLIASRPSGTVSVLRAVPLLIVRVFQARANQISGVDGVS